MTRRERVDAMISEGDVATLRYHVAEKWCGCMGAEGDEPLCRCEMTARQIREAVSYAALRRGVLVRLKGGAAT